jgi:hypothetical protein
VAISLEYAQEEPRGRGDYLRSLGRPPAGLTGTP